jgi:hypothetical protein
MPPERPQTPRRDQSLLGWGDPSQVPELPQGILDALGVRGAAPPVEIDLPEPSLPDAVVRELAGVCEIR